MISDVIRELLQEKDESRIYNYYNICFRWKNGKIIGSAREDLNYMVRTFHPSYYKSVDALSEAIENVYCIPLVYNFY